MKERSILSFFNNTLGIIAALLSIFSGGSSLFFDLSLDRYLASWISAFLLSAIGLLIIVNYPPKIRTRGIWISGFVLGALSVSAFFGFAFLNGYLPTTSWFDDYETVAYILVGLTYGFGCAFPIWLLGLIVVCRHSPAP